jgi:RecA/RadA recombinase
MGSFLQKINSIIQEKDLGKNIERQTYKMGCKALDYANGKFNRNNEVITGICGGKVITIAGKSGSGKSTLSQQIGINIIKNDDDAQMIIFDTEKTLSHDRIASLAKIDYETYRDEWEDSKVVIRNLQTNNEGLEDLVQELYRIKMSVGTSAEFTKEGRSKKNNEKKIREEVLALPPTVLIVDSWAKLASTKFETDTDNRSNMSGAQQAKANNELLKGCLEQLFEANIILIIVNHVSTIVNTDMYAPDGRSIKWLKKGESLPGGKDHVFYADFCIRMEQKAALKENEEFGIKGFINEIIICKSRSNASGTVLNLVFDQYGGLDDLYSNYLMLKNEKLITGGGRGFKLKTFDEVSFMQKNLREVYDTNKKFRKEFDKLVDELYTSNLKNSIVKNENADDEEDSNTSEDVTEEDIMAMTKKEFKEFCKENDIEIDWNDFDTLKEAKEAVIESLE